MTKSKEIKTSVNNVPFWLDLLDWKWLIDCAFADPKNEPFFMDTYEGPDSCVNDSSEDVKADPPGITAINMVSYESLMRSDQLDDATKLLIRPAIVSGLIRVGMVPGYDYPGYMHRYALMWFILYNSMIENKKGWVYAETSKGRKGLMNLGRFKETPSPFFKSEEYRPDLNLDSELTQSRFQNSIGYMMSVTGFETEQDANLVTFIEIDEEYIYTCLWEAPPWDKKNAPPNQQNPYWPVSLFCKDYWGEIRIPAEQIRKLNLSWMIEEGYPIISTDNNLL